MADSTTGLSFFEGCYLPSAHPDESLYSWCARFHRLNLGHDARTTSKILFGHPHAGLRHDIPYFLSTFEKQTKGHLGSAAEVLFHRTLFGFYARFLPDHIENGIARLFFGADNSIGRGRLGLKKTGRDFSNPLKFCPKCLAEQRAQYGYSWWQLVHQLPTSFVCSRHGNLLQVFPVTQYRGITQSFHLPHMPRGEHSQLPNSTPNRLREITEWGVHIWKSEHLRLSDETLRWCYRLQAKNRGWVAFDGSLRLQELRDEFVSHYGEMLRQFDSDVLGDLGNRDGGFLAYLFRQAPGRRHPIKHVMLLNFLFDSLGDFASVLRQLHLILDSCGVAGCEALLRHGQAELVRLVADGQSLARAAPLVGTSLTSAARFLDKHGGIARERRPHIVGTEKERVLCQLLDQGFSRKEIAETAGVRRAFIKDYLALRPEQRARWEKAYFRRETERHRAQLLAALSAYPGLPIKTIRRLPGNGFQWLYNNDREWLQEVLPAIWMR